VLQKLQKLVDGLRFVCYFFHLNIFGGIREFPPWFLTQRLIAGYPAIRARDEYPEAHKARCKPGPEACGTFGHLATIRKLSYDQRGAANSRVGNGIATRPLRGDLQQIRRTETLD
jgi:hypothetical protein